MIEITGLTFEELKEEILKIGFKSFRTSQIFQWIYQKGVFDFENMTNISKEHRNILKNSFKISIPSIKYIQESTDGTIKFALQLKNNNLVESVLIPDDKRLTLCLSTQVGCRMGCKFCFTAKMGFKRNLTPEEIVGQVLAAKFFIKGNLKVTNIVFMGMGEPFDNFENLKKSLKIILDENGLNFSSRRVTVSTCGILDKIVNFGEEFNVNLAVSLHSAFNDKRNSIMPVNKIYPLEKLIEICKKYPLKNRQRITFEYIMIDDFNDSLEDAKKLVSLIAQLKSKVNLIRFNSFPDANYKPSGFKKIETFQNYLISKGIATILRKSKGEDILAACGQLAGKLL
jgi:23S rRNA (adenine2503-C2)-methyltransferase